MNLKISQPVIAFDFRAIMQDWDYGKTIIDVLRDKGVFVLVYSPKYTKFTMVDWLMRHHIHVDGVDRKRPENAEQCVDEINQNTIVLLEKLTK